MHVLIDPPSYLSGVLNLCETIAFFHEALFSHAYRLSLFYIRAYSLLQVIVILPIVYILGMSREVIFTQF